MAGSSGSMPSLTILVVDDDHAVLGVIGQMLKGWNDGPIFFASTGERAEEIWTENGRVIDVLITDLTLQGRSGDRVAAAFHHCHPQARILVSTGWDVDATELEQTVGTRLKVLKKPFFTNELRAAVQNA